MRFVLDGSMALSWCFPDEKDKTTAAVLRSLSDGESAVVPALWFLELANAFVVGERKKRLSADDTAQALHLLRRLPIEIDERLGFPLADDLLGIARAHRLSAYDAAYLELALRRSLPLATLDRDMRSAADAAGVEVYAV